MPHLCDSQVSRWFSVSCAEFLNFPSFSLSSSLFPFFHHYCSMLLLRAALPCDFLAPFLPVVAFFEVCLFLASFTLCSIDKLHEFLILFFVLGF